jgi:hypothetical protein
MRMAHQPETDVAIGLDRIGHDLLTKHRQLDLKIGEFINPQIQTLTSS